MVGQFIVVGERFEEFNSKSGHKRVRRLSVLDQAEHSFINTVDWEPSAADSALLPEGKAKGKVITLGVTNIQPAFGGRQAIAAVLVQDKSGQKV